MKLLNKIMSIICVVAVLLAFPLSVSAIGFKAEEKYNSVFVVTSGNSLGSGFAIGENCIVTNAHVIGNSNKIILTTYSGETHSAFLVGMDEDKDIAVLGVKDVKFTQLKFDDYTTMNTGDDVYAIGAPKSMAYTLTKGVISAKERKIGNHTFIQTDAAINEGNSGGPLLNDAGNVIGINTLKMSDSEGIGLAIPSTTVIDYLKSLNIEIDATGNVPSQITPNAENEQPTNDENKDENEIKDEKSSFWSAPLLTIVLTIGLTISFGVNIFLIILLIFQKKKNLNLKYDPRERTDFDIDILE